MKVIRSYETKGGKELQLFVCPTTAHLKFQFSSGGELPVDLSGVYTSEYVANKAAEQYLNKKITEPKKSKED